MTNSELPADVDEIMDYIGKQAEMSGYFKWNEQEKLKADMMTMPHRWLPSRVSIEALRNKCRAVGLAEEETAKIVEWLGKIQEGRRLRPREPYRGFRFKQEPTDS
ncbi:hypothetical protein [Streptomyces europaeiscabiei]|uniref:hypothetical protein n=1 Tax=Streptomyces europaeiscabiei TaxID=146819 RepID=UPI0038F773F7